MDKELKISHPFDIPCYMFDCGGRLRPSSFFDIAQELAAEGSKVAGVSDADLQSYGIVWIIARMSLRAIDYPHRWDKVTVQTWHKKMDGVFFIRDYRILSEDGKEMMAGTSSWVLMDTVHRTIVRPDKLPGILKEGLSYPDSAIDESVPKIILPHGLVPEKFADHLVSYSDLDYNGHVNNAKYPVWALDALPIELVRSREVKELSINFNREVSAPETVELYRVQDGESWYVEGRCEGKGQVFICEVKF